MLFCFQSTVLGRGDVIVFVGRGWLGVYTSFYHLFLAWWINCVFGLRGNCGGGLKGFGPRGVIVLVHESLEEFC